MRVEAGGEEGGRDLAILLAGAAVEHPNPNPHPNPNGGGRDLAVLLAGAAVEQALPLLRVAAEEDARVGPGQG